VQSRVIGGADQACTVAEMRSAPAIRHATAVVDRLLDFALPASCVGCRREGSPLCDACRPALDARLDRPGGAPLGLPLDLPPPLLQLEWCAPYAGPVRRALRALKYDGERRLVEPLGSALARRWRAAGAGGDAFVFVPVHEQRARERGFDQAELLARAAARHLGLPTIAALERSRATVAQFELDRRERSANVRRAFRLRAGAERPIAGRWVVLVDDVVTTGSTLAECAQVLLAGGAVAVSAVTVARER
jgi:ComF family protein